MATILETDRRGGLRVYIVVPQNYIFVYSPHPDRQRFLVNQSVETGDSTVDVITNS